MILEDIINKKYDSLNENEQSIVSYILQNKNEIQNISITELAKICHTSRSTILRLAQKLGFSGFVEFKYSIKNSIDMNVTVSNEQEDLIDKLMNDIQVTNKLYSQTNLENIMKSLFESKRIYSYGTGWVQLNALNDFHRNIMLSGKTSMILQSKTELELLMTDFNQDDLLIIISKSGDNQSLSDIIRKLAINNVPVLSITEFKKNELATKTDYNLYFQCSEFFDKHRNNPTKKTFVTLHLLLDMLYRDYIDYENRRK